MDHGWFGVLDSLLRPARPELERCLRERDRQLGVVRTTTDTRARALADCVDRIDQARAVVLRADDGVVTAKMTELEREWLRLSREDPEAGLMDFWVSAAPAAWIDRKRFRDVAPEVRFDAATVLAADAANVERAERAVESLREELGRHGARLGARVRWRFFEQDVPVVPELSARAFEAAIEACSIRVRDAVVGRARSLEVALSTATLERFPLRPGLAADLGRAACLDFVFRAGPLARGRNPALLLQELYATGYVLGAWDASGVTLELPPLFREHHDGEHRPSRNEAQSG